jgi:O-antigen/teichoic acid export membrane protein
MVLLFSITYIFTTLGNNNTLYSKNSGNRRKSKRTVTTFVCVTLILTLMISSLVKPEERVQ